jgi:hypothetical protein
MGPINLVLTAGCSGILQMPTPPPASEEERHWTGWSYGHQGILPDLISAFLKSNFTRLFRRRTSRQIWEVSLFQISIPNPWYRSIICMTNSQNLEILLSNIVRISRPLRPSSQRSFVCKWNNGRMEGWNNDQGCFLNSFPKIPVLRYSSTPTLQWSGMGLRQSGV